MVTMDWGWLEMLFLMFLNPYNSHFTNAEAEAERTSDLLEAVPLKRGREQLQTLSQCLAPRTGSL